MNLKNHRGLTLVECMVSILVLCVLLTAGIGFFCYSQSSTHWSLHKRSSLGIATTALESIKSNGYSVLPDPAPTGNLWQGPIAVAVGNLSGVNNVYVYDVDEDSDGDTDYKRVQIVVSWQDPGKSIGSNVTLDTYIAP